MSDLHAQTVAYARDTMIPPAPPPVRERGAIRWMRANLFSGPLNITLTVLALAALWWLLSGFLPWAWRGVWAAGSVNECRAIRDALYGPGVSAACWAVIPARWQQLVFGFYPAAELWRPPLALAIFLVAVLPVLFANLPRWLLWVTGAAPFLIVWLIWGGTLWGPVVTALGIVLVIWATFAGQRGGWLPGILAGLGALTLSFWALEGLARLLALAPVAEALAPLGPFSGYAVLALSLVLWLVLVPWLGWTSARRGGLAAALLAGFGAFALVWLDPLGFALRVVETVTAPFVTDGGWLAAARGVLGQATPLEYRLPGLLDGVVPLTLLPVKSADIGGFTLSLVIGLSGITLSLPLGILLALARRSDLWIVSKMAVVYIEVIRGVPLIVWLLVAQILLNYFLPPGTNFDILVRVIIMVTLFAAAYLAEVVRGGLAALPRGQFEGADSLGLGYWQTMRLIVLPQALKISIPGIVNSFIGLLKDTTLVSIISLFDPKRVVDTIRATTEWGGIYWELYIFIGAVFFLFCFAMSRYSIWLERRLERSHR